VHYDSTLIDRPQKLLSLSASVRALIVRNRTQVRGELLTASPNQRVVGRLGVALDNIDMPACEGAGIWVLLATGANTSR
jgi:(S)-sulfolactate dehydrogenase